MSGSQMSGSGWDDEGRRCALPGCDREIRTASGRPERRYCSAAHRAAARQDRRAATRAQRIAADDVTLPWLGAAAGPAQRDAGGLRPDADDHPTGPVRRPAAMRVRPAVVGAAEPGAVARAAAHRSRDNRRAAPRRRRALVMIGVAGLVAGGYAVTARTEPPATRAPVQLTPEVDATPSAEEWARRATVALVAVDRQLDTLARAEEQWKRLPASRDGAVPAPVTALLERRAELQDRRCTLQTRLDAYASLRTTRDDLALSERQLREIEQALERAPAQRERSAEQEAAAAALTEQRDLRIRRRDAQRAEIGKLEEGVSAAIRTPLPDDEAVTAKVSGDVLDLVGDGGPTKRDDGSTEPRPMTVPGSVRPGSMLLEESGADTVALLHEQARRVAREVRRVEAAKAAAEQEVAARAAALPSPGIAGSVVPVAVDADRPDVADKADDANQADGVYRADGADPVGVDDDAIEEQNAARWAARVLAESGRHRPSA